jgi:hypothetical protein
MKTLLMLVGGRPIPNALTVIHEEPDTIIAICSKESIKNEWVQLKQVIEKLLPSATIKETSAVDAFDIEAITAICERELLAHLDTEQILNVTAGTSLMTLGAYIAAERCSRLDGASIRCWYLDTAHSSVKSLLGERRDSDIFGLSVEQYINAYNYRLQDAGGYKNYRKRYLQKNWLTFAQRLGKRPQEILLLKQILQELNKPPKKIVKTTEAHNLLQELETVGLIRNLHEEGIYLSFSLSNEQYTFLDGAWLELYVYQEALALDIADSGNNVLWSQEIIDNDPNRVAKSPLLFNDMDVSLTYKAHLVIIECKTGDKGLASQTLDDIVSMSDLLGRGFVIKVLVTSKSSPKDMDEDFKTKARIKGVRLVTLEDLPNVGALIEEQAKKAVQLGR